MSLEEHGEVDLSEGALSLSCRLMAASTLISQFDAMEELLEDCLGLSSDSNLEKLVDGAMIPVCRKVIEWSHAILDGNPPAGLSRKFCVNGQMSRFILNANFHEDIIIELRKLTATELRKVLPSDVFQVVMDYAAETLDEPWAP